MPMEFGDDDVGPRLMPARKPSSMSMIDAKQSMIRLEQKVVRKASIVCSLLMSTMLDFISLGDMISDIYIIWALMKTEHTFWFSFSTLTILLPFLIAQVPYLNFKLEKYVKDFNESKRRSVVGFIYQTPLILFYFILLDVIFLVVSLGMTIVLTLL